MGFDDAGNGIVRQRTVYGTKLLRLPYPSATTNDIATDGDGCIVRVALSEIVYVKDSNIVLTALSGAYAVTNGGGTNCNAASFTITNVSTATYPAVIGNWSWRGFRVIDEEYLTLRAVAFHKCAEQGRPIRAAMFWVTDSGGTSFTNWQTQMQIDRAIPDATPVQEYVARFATNTLASGLVVCNVRLYPWVGDTALDSSTTGYLEPTPYLCPLTNAVNYPRVRAIVSNIGNDTGSFAYDETFWATNQSPSNFLTIGKAMTAIYNTNNGSYSRAGWGGGIIYLMDGDYGWFGTSLSLDNSPTVELLITPYPGQTAVLITNYAADQIGKVNGDIYRAKGLTFKGASTYLAKQYYHAWFDQCTLTNVAGTWFWGGGAPTTAMVHTHCTFENDGSLVALAADNSPVTLFRGNAIGTNCGANYTKLFTLIGNYRYHPGPATAFIWNYDQGGQISPKHFPAIFAYNRSYNHTGNALTIPSITNAITTGAAIVQNVFECASTDASAGFVVGRGAADSGPSMTNVLVWHNIFQGKRMLRAYNELGTNPVWSIDTSWIGNMFDWAAHKGDDYTGTGQDGRRVGSFEVYHGVGSRNNFFGYLTNNATGFNADFHGINSRAVDVVDFESWHQDPTNYWKITLQGGYTGQVTNAPGGNYRLLSDSPLFSTSLIPSTWVLPYDLEGVFRGASDPPGAYVSGNVRKSIW